jgi:hypothetical protein
MLHSLKEEQSYKNNTWGLYYKTLRIRNWQKNYKFRSKLRSSGLDKNTSLDKQIH